MLAFSEETLARILFVLVVAIVATSIAAVRLFALWRTRPNGGLSSALLGRVRLSDPELHRRADLFRWLFVITAVWFVITAAAIAQAA